ncbi:WGR domain-containing protein [Sulfitobacter sp. KE34]|uniref:WGR domain-containing protein n=2 Tax=Sulfitobacter TaxID=60136 RepID=UPI0029EA2B48|nr:WGR domain-containing protein [Sulfitobacter sp. KE12]MDF3355616.1 WGR domain-containing protein [Sulfitobacter sp. KE27]MDF3359307.1 WGR domain-containing protein [Sulfitobacter sp. KE33]MDF3366746.1 WGR domain-containing protein [Sulfitobacter sp. Ks34]MDF3370307.1 WGR domain-containing protein [Sulfitobacter sp. Ks43]MDF3373925.1 WGR domain-containing protein [Sulfitobacter sp. KS8]MDF3377591.1 WGR domain-containing protein [Sulfitobacter sp. KE37]MDF3395166.1 WGR domain-containing pro
MSRFYRMIVQRDLFGGASLIRETGRIGSADQVWTALNPDEGRAVTALMTLAAEKRRRGYVL